MNKQRDDIKDLFYDKLHGLEQSPPPEVWEKIADYRSTRKRRIGFWYSAAAIALLLLTTVPFWQLNNENKKSLPEASNAPELNLSLHSKVTSLQSIKRKNAENDVVSVKKERDLLAQVRQRNVIQAQTSTDSPDEKASFDVFPAAEANLISDESAQEQLDETVIASLVSRDENTGDKYRLAQWLLNSEFDGELEDQRRNDKKQKERAQLSLAYGSVPGGTVTANELLYENNNVSYRTDAFQSDIAYETTFYEEVERTDIYPPLTLGLKFSYRVGRRLSLETGISYTALSVLTKTVVMDDIHSEYVRTLHYIGLPAGLRWDAFKDRWFTGYVQQSVMIEKGVRAINKSLRYDKGQLFESDQSGMRVPGVQLSTLSSLGADVSVYRHVSLYGEGGLQIFYLNGTQPFNLRSAKMMWPVFHTGIRVKF